MDQWASKQSLMTTTTARRFRSALRAVHCRSAAPNRAVLQSALALVDENRGSAAACPHRAPLHNQSADRVIAVWHSSPARLQLAWMRLLLPEGRHTAPRPDDAHAA